MSHTARQIEAARAGDRQALDSLFHRHQGRLLGFVRATMDPRLARRVSAEDIVQETLLESARKIDGFEARGKSSFYRWMVEIARFKLHEARRAQQAAKRAREEPLEQPVHAAQTSPSGRAMRSEGAVLLREALSALPDRQAQAVCLRYLEGKTVAETAVALACSEPAVKALVSRGLQELSARLTPETGFSPRPPDGSPPSGHGGDPTS